MPREREREFIISSVPDDRVFPSMTPSPRIETEKWPSSTGTQNLSFTSFGKHSRKRSPRVSERVFIITVPGNRVSMVSPGLATRPDTPPPSPRLEEGASCPSSSRPRPPSKHHLLMMVYKAKRHVLLVQPVMRT